MSNRLQIRLSIPEGSPLFNYLVQFGAAAARLELMCLANNGLKFGGSGVDKFDDERAALDDTDRKTPLLASLDIHETDATEVDIGSALDNYIR